MTLPAPLRTAISKGKSLLRGVLKMLHFDEAGLGAGQVSSQKHSMDASKPLSTEGWESAYSQEEAPVQEMVSPVSKALHAVVSPAAVLLEAGCGSARLSAELAATGHQVILCDFSQNILLRAQDLFSRSGLPKPRTVHCDLTKGIPLDSRSVDVVWSSGVLEHWDDEEMAPIVKEMARVANDRVVSFVPSAACVLYRLGMASALQKEVWPFGREIPRRSLRSVFESANLEVISETRLWFEGSLVFLRYLGQSVYEEAVRWYAALEDTHSLDVEQGYLLMTVGRHRR